MGKDGFLTPKAIANRMKVRTPDADASLRSVQFTLTPVAFSSRRPLCVRAGQGTSKAAVVLRNVPETVSRRQRLQGTVAVPRRLQSAGGTLQPCSSFHASFHAA